MIDGQLTIQQFITYSCMIGDSIQSANGINEFKDNKVYVDFAIKHIEKTLDKSERGYNDERYLTMLRHGFGAIGQDFISKIIEAFNKVKSMSLEKLDKQILKQLSSPNEIKNLKYIDISRALYKLSKEDLKSAISEIKNNNESLQILLTVIKQSAHNTKRKEYQHKMQDLFTELAEDPDVGSVSRMILYDLVSEFKIE